MYERNISRLQTVDNRIQTIEREWPEFVKDPDASARINSTKRALRAIDNPEAAESGLRAIESNLENYQKKRKQIEEEKQLAQKIADLQKWAKDRLTEAQKIGTVPESFVRQATAKDISTLKAALSSIDDFLKNARPVLEISLGTTQFTTGKWYKVAVTLSNAGNAHAFDVSFSFSEEFETKRIKPTQVDAGKTATINIGLIPKNAGSIPFEITVHYADGNAREYSETYELWIEVVDPTGGLSAFDRSGKRGPSQKPDTGNQDRILPVVSESVQSPVHHDVFITHSNMDKSVTDAVCAALEKHAIRCWIASRDILPGMQFQESIIDAIDASSIMVIIFSSHSNISPYVISEVTEAMSKGVIIIPFRIEDVTPSKAMKFLIGTSQWLDALTPPLEQHIDKLIERIEAILNKSE